jgi:predicted XRE-type DNA-binding protein
MKIRSVRNNNRKKAFELKTSSKELQFPHSKLAPPPSASDPVRRVFVDRELGGEAVSYVLQSGRIGTVHLEQVLEYNQDPRYMRDALLYQLTIEAQQRLEQSALSKREIIRRLGTCAAQFYRLLDQKNYRKSVDQLLHLLRVLDCDVELIVRTREDPRRQAA